jgi:hypothetical protein
MKTPPNLVLGGVDDQLQNQRGHRQYGWLRPRYIGTSHLDIATASVSATKNRPEAACRTVKRSSRHHRVDHSRCPLMGPNEYRQARILKGKWVLHA